MNIFVDESNLKDSEVNKLHTIINQQYAPIFDSISDVEDTGRFDVGKISICFDEPYNVANNMLGYDKNFEINFRDEESAANAGYRIYMTDKGFDIIVSKDAIAFIGFKVLHAIIDIIVSDTLNVDKSDDISCGVFNTLIVTYTSAILMSNPIMLLYETFTGQSIVYTLMEVRKHLQEGVIEDEEVPYITYFQYLVKLTVYMLIFTEFGATIEVRSSEDAKPIADKVMDDTAIIRPYVSKWIDNWMQGSSFTNTDVNSVKMMYATIVEKMKKE